ncbi:hypothetical protein, partial [Phaeobacter gallaeciensis]|uniref:hypothetical protein n=1 Tax=Phaeobacter gallaeciensis TaxID=60890 RepID=UPI00237F0922
RKSPPCNCGRAKAEEQSYTSSRDTIRGLRISLPWLVNVLDGDGKLARHVLRRAGFSPDPATWSTGRGAAELGDFSYPPVLADNLTDVLDDFAPA